MITPAAFQKDLFRFDDVTTGHNLAHKKDAGRELKIWSGYYVSHT